MHYASRLFTLGLQELLIESGLVFVDLTTYGIACLCLN